MHNMQYHLDSKSRWNIVTATATAKNSLVYIQEIGDYYAGNKYFTTRSSFPSYLLSMTVDGCGILEYNGQIHKVPAGHFFWLDCANPQHYYTDPETGSWHVMWVHFFGANAASYYETFLSCNRNAPVAAVRPHLSIYDIFMELLDVEHSGTNQLKSDLLISGLLTQLMSQCVVSTMESRHASDMPQIVQSIRLYLQNHYKEKHTLQELGARFNINPYYLQKQFKRYTGQSPTEFLIYLRINRAKELMRSNRYPIGEIAYAVGIENFGYFTRLFKQQEGITPQEYRRLWPALEHPPLAESE